MKNENKKIVSAFMLVTQIGISMMTPIFLCVIIGVIVQNKTGFEYSVPIGILLGVASAFRNVFILTKKMYFKDMEKENEELKYFKDLEKEREGKK